MKIDILAQAEQDLLEGKIFYEQQERGVGAYFLSSLLSDIESLRLYAGIHPIRYRNMHRMLSKRFPFAIYYSVVSEDQVLVHSVADCRREPAWIRKRLE